MVFLSAYLSGFSYLVKLSDLFLEAVFIRHAVLLFKKNKQNKLVMDINIKKNIKIFLEHYETWFN